MRERGGSLKGRDGLMIDETICIVVAFCMMIYGCAQVFDTPFFFDTTQKSRRSIARGGKPSNSIVWRP